MYAVSITPAKPERGPGLYVLRCEGGGWHLAKGVWCAKDFVRFDILVGDPKRRALPAAFWAVLPNERVIFLP